MKNCSTPASIERELIRSLREKGYKLTAQRLEIIRLLAKDTTHPGAMEILKSARKRAPRISMSTVYYTLDMLKKEGLIHELEFYERENRYDVNIAAHINLICKTCGKIEDFPGALACSVGAVKEKTGFMPVGMRFEYYGYCKECGKKRTR